MLLQAGVQSQRESDLNARMIRKRKSPKPESAVEGVVRRGGRGRGEIRRDGQDVLLPPQAISGVQVGARCPG